MTRELKPEAIYAFCSKTNKRQKFDVNHKDEWTALMRWAEREYVNVAKHLIYKGATLRPKTNTSDSFSNCNIT